MIGLVEKKKVGVNTRLIGLVLCGALGLLLLLYGGGILGDDEDGKSAVDGEAISLLEYTQQLEESIEKLCAGVSGVSEVRVAVTLENGFEYVYATDSEVKSDGLTEYKYITVGSGSREGTVYITEKPPKIGGVGVVCKGGDNAEVQRKLISLISAAYNVSSNKIYIIGR